MRGRVYWEAVAKSPGITAEKYLDYVEENAVNHPSFKGEEDCAMRVFEEVFKKLGVDQKVDDNELVLDDSDKPLNLTVEEGRLPDEGEDTRQEKSSLLSHSGDFFKEVLDAVQKEGEEEVKVKVKPKPVVRHPGKQKKVK